MTATIARQLRSIDTAANYLNVSTRTIRRKIATGDLPAYRVGGVIRIDQADLDALLRPIPAASGKTA